jgi:hypothetical protein
MCTCTMNEKEREKVVEIYIRVILDEKKIELNFNKKKKFEFMSTLLNS